MSFSLWTILCQVKPRPRTQIQTKTSPIEFFTINTACPALWVTSATADFACSHVCTLLDFSPKDSFGFHTILSPYVYVSIVTDSIGSQRIELGRVNSYSYLGKKVGTFRHFLRGRVFLRIVIHTHAIISWCSLWELLTVRQPPISPCRTPRRCSRPRASWGRCQRRARLLESSFCNCYSKWSRSLSFLRRNSRDRKPLHGLKEGRDEHENGRYQRRHPCRSSWWLLRRITFPGSKDNRHSVRGGAERKEISACAAEQSKFRSCRQQTHFLSQKRRLAA